MRIIWLTDTHLNDLTTNQQEDFFRDVKSTNPDAIWLTGDIANGYSVEYFLRQFRNKLDVPIYFVLGNHDYYWKYFDFYKVRDENIFYLEREEPIYFDDFALIGTDGWYDAMWHKPVVPLIYCVDWFCIDNVRNCKTYMQMLDLFKETARKKTEVLEKKLVQALEKKTHAYILTHFPPAIIDYGSSWLGRLADNIWKPYDLNASLYDCLQRMAGKFPDKQITVLCGHTHLQKEVRISPNILVKVGKASIGSFQGELINV